MGTKGTFVKNALKSLIYQCFRCTLFDFKNGTTFYLIACYIVNIPLCNQCFLCFLVCTFFILRKGTNVGIKTIFTRIK